MIIKIWLGLTILALLVQITLAYKTAHPLFGLILPVPFLIFACYAYYDLAPIGIAPLVLSSFFIPPVLLACLFFLLYWKKRWAQCTRK